MVQILETVTATGLPDILSLDSFTPAADQAVRTATLTLDPSRGSPHSGDEVTLSLSGELVLTGYVRDVRRSHGDKERSLSVSICSRTVDATECSCDLDGGEFDDQSLDKIAKNADKLGIGIVSDGDMPVLKRHKVTSNDTLFSTLQRRAHSSGIYISDTPKGKLKLSSKPDGRHAGGLIRGVNIKSASSTETEQGRYSKVKVRGQLPRGSKAKDLRAEGSATDSGIKRNRPLIIRQDGEATVSELKARADRAVREAAGNSVSASITTVGWRDAARKLWTPNYLVYVKDDDLEIDGDMLIKSVTFSQTGNEGTKAVINLVDPRAMGGENPRGKTSKAYAAPTDTATSFAEEE